MLNSHRTGVENDGHCCRSSGYYLHTDEQLQNSLDMKVGVVNMKFHGLLGIHRVVNETPLSSNVIWGYKVVLVNVGGVGHKA